MIDWNAVEARHDGAESERPSVTDIIIRLYEAADLLRALSGDDNHQLADACEYAAHHIPGASAEQP